MAEGEYYVSRVGALYAQYRMVVKPPLASVEAEYEKFPIPIYNEIRSLTDHLSRCFDPGGSIKSEDEINKQCESAEHHIKRAILDCYKLLLIASRDRVEKFEKSTRYLDLRTIDPDGEFSHSFLNQYREAKRLVREAKRAEANSQRREDAFGVYEAYQDAHNAYSRLEEYIEAKEPIIMRAKLRFFAGKVGWIVTSIVSFIAGNLLSNNNEAIVDWLLSIFQ